MSRERYPLGGEYKESKRHSVSIVLEGALQLSLLQGRYYYPVGVCGIFRWGRVELPLIVRCEFGNRKTVFQKGSTTRVTKWRRYGLKDSVGPADDVSGTTKNWTNDNTTQVASEEPNSCDGNHLSV
jgi:hypothetical protein